MGDANPDFDAVCSGAGFSGMHMLNARDRLGLEERVYEAGETVGGPGIGAAIPGPGAMQRRTALLYLA